MPSPTPDDLRLEVWQRFHSHEPPAAIAAALRLSPRTVRHLLRQFRRHGGPTPPQTDRCGRRPSPAFAALREQTLALRREHPRWGAQRILAQLGGRPGLPDPGTVRRWLRHAGLAPPANPPAVAAVPAPRASRPHEVWQMGAAESKALRGGQKVSWLRLVDEATNAVLFTRVFPLPSWATVAASAVQTALRDAFGRWGRPLGLRVDNGRPWVCPDSDLPTDLELWLAGLAVATHKNRPNVPQDNTLVERSQRTAAAWGEPHKHDTPEQLQARLDEEDRVQREVYLFDGERTRMEAYPELRWLGNPYAAGAWEAIFWDHQAALACLGRLRLSRRVDKDGRVSLYDHRHRLGTGRQGQVVGVTLSVVGQEWVFTHQSQEVGREPAWYLGQENICGLQIRRRPERAQQRRAAKQALAKESR